MKRLSSFMQNQNGNAAVEFALVFPIMIILFMGLFEVTYYLNVSLKLSNAAQSIANMAAQQTQVTTAIATNLCDGGKISIAPLAGASLKAAMASVTHYTASTTVDWQDTTCGGATAISGAPALASVVIPNVGDSTIIVQATYTYSSPLHYLLASNYTLTKTVFARPRGMTAITHS